MTWIQSRSEAKIAEKFQKEMELVKGIRILRKKRISDDELVATLFVDGQDDLTKRTFKRFGNDWKFTGEKKIR